MQDLKRYEICNGIYLNYIKTDKYKTNTLSFYFYDMLDHESATKNALLMEVISRGSKVYTRTADLERFLEEQYGANMETGVRKKGDVQVLYANFDFVHTDYVDKKDICENIFSLAESIIFNQESFSDEFVAQEKVNHREKIEALMNNKTQYAMERCVEEMCADEPYGICEFGELDLLEAINATSILEHYKNTFLKLKFDVFITGEIDVEWALERLRKTLGNIRCTNNSYLISSVVKDIGEVKKIVQREPINQSKLVLGFRNRVLPTDDNYYALVLYNSIYGGSVFSKLFNNVREKLSLAYSVGSRTDKFKGIMFVAAGIENDKFQEAYDEILTQEQLMKDGSFIEDEVNAAKLSLIDSIRAIADSAKQTEDYYVGQFLCNMDGDLEELVQGVEGVTAEQVTYVAQNVELDTVYFLTGLEE